MTKYLVGFDRFVALDWANFALRLTSNDDSQTSRVAQLKDWLSTKISGKESLRKTINVLVRLWLEPMTDVNALRRKAVELSSISAEKDYVLLQWGMALAVFPFFRETCIQIGRLAALQPTISRSEIHARISEKYSNQSTIPRSVDRIFQTLLDWKVLIKTEKHRYAIVSHDSSETNAKRWLLEAVIFTSPNQRVALNGFYRLPELFPFELNGEVRPLLHESPNVKIERDGSEIEYAVWIYRKT